jgi:hypothetical protein
MDAMVRFVRDRNVARFVDQFRLQYDPTIRAFLQRLLLEEIRKLGFNFEQLSMVDRQIFEARERIRAQTDIIERLRIKGYDTMWAERLLDDLVGIQEIFEQQRQFIADSVDRLQRL